jgi:Tol biopolymer transport system component
VAFNSRAPNLPSGNGTTDRVYARDMKTGVTKIVSVKTNGDAAVGGTGFPVVSANGRYVAFSGLGTGLPGSDGVHGQVWVHDRKSRTTKLVSKSDAGDPGDQGSSAPSISSSGRYVAFTSQATNFGAGNGTLELMFMRDMKKGKTFAVSRNNQGAPVPADGYGQLVSSDGRFVAFQSDAASLPAGDGSMIHTYLRDRKRQKTILVDRSSGGDPGDENARSPSISANGRFVAFTSEATNLAGPTGGANQIYLRDLKKGTTKLVSKTNAGDPQDGGPNDPEVSADGRMVAFDSDSSNLPGGDGSTFQTYVRDLGAGKTVLLSKAGNGDPGDDDSYYVSISRDGRFVAYDGYADNLPGDPDYSNLLRTGPLR